MDAPANKRVKTHSYTHSWLAYDAESDFSIHNIPFGAGRRADSGETHVFTRIGDYVSDLLTS